MGIAEVKHFDEDIDTVIKRADINLYKEKGTKCNFSRD